MAARAVQNPRSATWYWSLAEATAGCNWSEG